MKIKTTQVIFVVVVVFTLMFFTLKWSNEPQLPPSTDLNNDGEVNIQDFSIALYLVEEIQKEMRNFHQPENVIEDVYPDVPPYSPNR